MVLKPKDWTSELCNHKILKIYPTDLTSKSQVRICIVNYGKIIFFFFMVLMAQVRTCELRDHEKNKISQPTQHPELWHQFRKNQNFCFYGPKGTCADL